MRIIAPLAITGAIFTDSNIPEDDAAAWSGATNYALGDRVINTTAHKLYESVQAGNLNHDPTTDDGSWWIEVSATKPWRLFDDSIASNVQVTGDMTFELTPGALVTSAALFGLFGGTVNLTITSASAGGVVYDETVDLTDLSGIINWWYYFFADRSDVTEDVVFENLPPYLDAVMTFTITGGGGGVSRCGEAVIGKMTELGVTNFKTSVGITDYSRKELDDFGVPRLVVRNFSKRADFDVTLETDRIAFVQRYLARLRAAPCVFIGDAEREETIIYGFYKDFNVVIDNPSISPCTISVEGLT